MRITESQLRQIVREEISEMAARGRLEEGPSVQKGIDKDKKILVDVLQGMKSTPKTKTFKNMAAYEKWADSEAAEDFEIKRVYNE
jgi:hypothetical protein